MAPFRTRQTLLALDDNILEGHTAKEVDIKGDLPHPLPGPLRLAQHWPLTLPFNMNIEVSASQRPALCPVPALLPCSVPPLSFALETCSGVLGALAPQLLPSLC